MNLNMELKEYKLGDLIEVTRGMSLPGEFYSTEGKYIRLTCGNFDYVNNSFKENKSKDDLYYVGKIKPEFIMEKGDIITPLTEQAIGLLGSTAIIPESGKYIQSQDVAKVTCKKGMIDHDFAYYLIPSKCVKEQLSAAAQQTKIRHTSPDAIKACKVFVPPLSEQKKIASVLSALDDKIALNKKMNQKLEAMAKRLYDYWFVQYDFPDKNGHPYKTTGGPMTYNPTLKREIPAGWEVDNLYAVADYINGLACQNKRPKSGENALPVIKIREMSEGITSDTEEVSENIPLKYIVENGDILFSWSATLMVMIWAGGKGGLNQHIFKVVPKAGFPKEFVYQLLSDYVVNFQQIALSRKTTMGHITSDHINLSRVVLPPENVLKRYAEKVCPIFDKVVRNQVEYRKLTTLRDKLLPLLMNGQVIVD